MKNRTLWDPDFNPEGPHVGLKYRETERHM